MGQNSADVRDLTNLTQNQSFAAQAEIVCLGGCKAASDIRAGDLVLTRDNGFRMVQAVTSQSTATSGAGYIVYPQSLGLGMPQSAISLLGDSKLLLPQAISEALGLVGEYLIEVQDLSGLIKIRRSFPQAEDRFNIVLEGADMILANGLWIAANSLDCADARPVLDPQMLRDVQATAAHETEALPSGETQVIRAAL